MATRFINKGLGAPEATGNHIGIGEDRYGALQVNQSGASATSTFLPVLRFVSSTATTSTLTQALNGTVVICDTTASQTVVLPAARPGLVYGIVVGIATTTGGHKLTPATGDTIQYVAATASSAVQCSAATDAIGDMLIVMGSGTAGIWNAVSAQGTWASAAA